MLRVLQRSGKHTERVSPRSSQLRSAIHSGLFLSLHTFSVRGRVCGREQKKPCCTDLHRRLAWFHSTKNELPIIPTTLQYYLVRPTHTCTKNEECICEHKNREMLSNGDEHMNTHTAWTRGKRCCPMEMYT